MRKLMLIAASLAAVIVPATAASAQRYGGGYGYNGGGYGYNQGYRGNRVQREVRECRRELRRADNRWEYQRELRECRREINQARRGHRGGWDRRGW